MDLQVNDKVVIITGAAAGIGQATAHLLTAEGAIVVGIDRDDIESGLGPEGSAISADLTDATSAPRSVETVIERYGRIDGLVNNAGGLRLHSGATHCGAAPPRAKQKCRCGSATDPRAHSAVPLPRGGRCR
jgi:NAD(P)-dependent dehydrogenase (short-subunit alcohol dehydrogenase family)